MAYVMKAGEGASSSPVGVDEDLIRDLVRWLEISWNSSASAGFAAPFSDDADFVTIFGAHYTSRSSVEANHRHIFDTIYKESRIAYNVEKIRFVRPDVAIAFVRVRLQMRNGKMLEARPNMVLVKDNERWQIVCLQNTLIGEMTL